MVKVGKVHLFMALVVSLAYSASLDNVINLNSVINISNKNKIEIKSNPKNVFAMRKTSGMEMIITDKTPKEKRTPKNIDLSLKDVIAQILAEDNSENRPTVFNEQEHNETIGKNSIKVEDKTPKYLGSLDRALEINYKNLRELNSQKFIYLTFDDGPLRGTTNVLKILEDERVDATMFCVGKHILRKKELFQREQNMSNLLIVNHTYAHANGKYRRFYSNIFRVMSDIEHNQLIVGGGKFLRLAGRNVWRLPEVKRDDYGIPRSQRKVEVKSYNQLAKDGFFVVGWDVEWGFNHRNGMPTCSAKALASRIETLYKRGRLAKRGKAVLLTHDFMFRNKNSANELKSFIKLMKKKGWKFKKINHYVSIQPSPLKYAKYYKPSQKAQKTLLASKSIKSKKYLHTELNRALKDYDIKKVNYILSMGIDPNHRDKYGRLALNTAIKINNFKMVKKLIAHGAKLTVKDKWGNTPISTAKRYKRKRIARYLKKFMLPRGTKKHTASNDKEKIVAKVTKIADTTKVKKRRDALSILRLN